jgi:peptidoglycan/xylan/chitin deacetylase (PgdA/CDA1 family)/RNase H-fold protein (predicted Holliday junction resolvase)
MSARKWCITFVVSVILVLLGLIISNIIIDPFGVFGDKLFNWFSYDITNNPRVAKITYLDKNYEKYDSYIIGCSSTSSFPTETLNKYFNAKFYNMIMYGADMLDVEETCNYIIDNYNVKNIVLNVYISNGTKYNEEENNITRNLHKNVNGESDFSFYSRYALLDPRYAVAKIRAKFKDTYLTQPFDVFNVETGAYDKKVRDAEPLGDLKNYLDLYPVFKDYPKESSAMPEIDNTIESLKRIKEKCENSGVNLVVISAPVYYENLLYFSKEDVEKFYSKIAEVTPFWDFTSSSISKEPRYFYDESHFRNAVGNMAIAKIFGDKNVYIPDDFGEYVTSENVKEHVNNLWNVTSDPDKYTKDIKILVYHNISESEQTGETISKYAFENDMKDLIDNGYTAVLFDDLISYVEKGIELPEKPVLITFDDGYLSNYEIAFPILKKYNMKATIFVIGVSVGKTKYKDTENIITPHFSYEQAREMIASGLISIESHTYDMHQWAPFETNNIPRENILKFNNETEEEYISALTNDYNKINADFNNELNKNIKVVAFPNGKTEKLTDVVLSRIGVKATVTTIEGDNTIIKGLPQSLYRLNRYSR